MAQNEADQEVEQVIDGDLQIRDQLIECVIVWGEKRRVDKTHLLDVLDEYRVSAIDVKARGHHSVDGEINILNHIRICPPTTSR